VAEAARAGVERIVTIGMGEESSRRARRLAAEHPGVYAAVGVHPHDAGAFGARDLDWIREVAADPKVVAIGECGLDFYRDHAPRYAQAEAFRAQIAVARELDLPLVIHTRDAGRPTLDILAAEAGDHPVVMHCFSLPEHVDEVVERGYMVSFAGPVTYRRAHELQRAAATVPLDRLLVETDSPYLAPEPRRGRPNVPANVAYTLGFIARLRDMPVDELDRVTSDNAARAFGW
jgi:TatD DNase family protein